eukprot:3459355-Lingulodinium_polyedra.AAC.1
MADSICASMAQPCATMRCARRRCGAGHTMATPPCVPPCGPRRAGAAAIRACGIRPACHTAAVVGSQ